MWCMYKPFTLHTENTYNSAKTVLAISFSSGKGLRSVWTMCREMVGRLVDSTRNHFYQRPKIVSANIENFIAILI